MQAWRGILWLCESVLASRRHTVTFPAAAVSPPKHTSVGSDAQCPSVPKCAILFPASTARVGTFSASELLIWSWKFASPNCRNGINAPVVCFHGLLLFLSSAFVTVSISLWDYSLSHQPEVLYIAYLLKQLPSLLAPSAHQDWDTTPMVDSWASKWMTRLETSLSVSFYLQPNSWLLGIHKNTLQ